MKNVSLTLILALSLAACQQPAESPETPAFPSGTLVDLTYAFNDSSIYWPTASQEFELTPEFEGEEKTYEPKERSY